MKLKSLELAKLIINSFEVRDDLLQRLTTQGLGSNELLSIILQKNVEDLAYWLSLHSFTKYQLEQKLKDFKEIDIQKPDRQVVDAVNAVIEQYFKEQLKKLDIKKFLAEDFSELTYFEREAVLRQLLEVTLQRNSIREKDVQYLINAKSHTAEELGRHLNLKYISAKDYASESTTRKLAKTILGLKPGERQQILYYYLGQEHAFAFDAEVDANGKIKIFCFESAGDPRHLEGIDRLYQYLKKSGKEFELRTCRAQMQKDATNCALYAIGVLNEFAKYDHVYDYVEKDFVPDTSLHDYKEEEVTNAASQKTVYTFPNLDKITWVKLSDMPTKIISMGQSFTQMVEVLEEKKFDLSPEKFVEKVQERDKYEENKDETKYISRRRQHITQRLKKAQAQILQPAYEVFLKNNPVFEKINNGETVDYRKEITLNPKYPSLRDKLNILDNYMRIILGKYDITLNYVGEKQVKSMSLNDQRAFLEIRNEYLRNMSPLSLQEFRNEYSSDRSSPLKTNLDQYINFSSFHPPIPSAHSVVWQTSPDHLATILKEDPYTRYPHYFTIPNPLVFDPQKINEVTEQNIKNLIRATAANYLDNNGNTALDESMILRFLNSYATEIDKALGDNFPEKQRLFAVLQPIFLSYVSKIPNLDYIAGDFYQSPLFNYAVPSEEVANDEQSLKATQELISKFFTDGQITYLRKKLPSEVKKFFPPIEEVNPIFTMLQDKENLENKFTAENIVQELDKAEKRYTYRVGESYFPRDRAMLLLQETMKTIHKNMKKYALSDEEFLHVFYQMSCAYYRLADQSPEPGNAITAADGILRNNFYFMLGDNFPKLTADSILQNLSYLKDPFLKLRIIQYAFYNVHSGDGYVNKNKLSLSRFSQRQQEDIKALQKAYLHIFAEAAKNKSDEKVRKNLRFMVKYSQPLIDFHSIIFAKFIETDMRKQMTKLFPPEYIPPPPRPPKTEPKKVEKPKEVGTSTSKSKFFFGQTKSLGDIALAYYHTQPMLSKNGVASEYVRNKTYDLNMCMFTFDQVNVKQSLWVSYGSAKAKMVDNEYDWKLNFSVDGQDIEKALKIMVEIVVKYNIGSIKVMSPDQYNFTRGRPHMPGRELVMFCHYNPEITQQKKWLDIVHEIENKFNEAGIKPSVEKCPTSNRQIGKYTSYTHEAWTAKKMSISFEEGIEEAGLADEDPFQNYTYVPQAEQKTAPK